MIGKKNLEIDKSYFVDASSLSGKSEDQVDDSIKAPEEFVNFNFTNALLEGSLKKRTETLDFDEFTSSYVTVKQKFRF